MLKYYKNGNKQVLRYKNQQELRYNIVYRSKQELCSKRVGDTSPKTFAVVGSMSYSLGNKKNKGRHATYASFPLPKHTIFTLNQTN